METYKKIIGLIIGLILLGLSFLSTYLFDLVKGNDGRELLIVNIGVFSFIGGLFLIIFFTVLLIKED